MLMHGAEPYPQDHSLQRLFCPHRTFSPPLTTQAWLSFWALHSLLRIYVDVFCANLAVLMMVGLQSTWKSDSLGQLKSTLLGKGVWTLTRVFCLSRHIWEFLVVLV